MPGERAGDGDDRLLRPRQLGDRPVEGKRRAEEIERPLGGGFDRLPVDEPRRAWDSRSPWPCSRRRSSSRSGRGPDGRKRQRPWRRRSKGWPAMRMSPPSAACTPARILISVDLPAPLAPSRACISPRSTVKSTPRSASVPPKRLVRPLTSRTGRSSATVSVERDIPSCCHPGPERNPHEPAIPFIGILDHLMRLALRFAARQAWYLRRRCCPRTETRRANASGGARMTDVRRLDATFHFEEACIRDRFDIEDARGKPSHRSALSELTHMNIPRRRRRSDYLAKTRRGDSRKGGR